MHASTEELLALRDGDASLETVDHVDGCPECAVRLMDLERLVDAMRRLPVAEPPADGWARIKEQAGRRHRVRRVRLAVAAAAVLIVAAGVAGVSVEWGHRVAKPAEVAAGSEEPLSELMAASQTLESVLQSPPLRSPVMRPAQAARIVVIEDHIAFIDIELGSTPDLTRDREVALWSGRVELLDELVRTRGRAGRGADIEYAVNGNEGRIP